MLLAVRRGLFIRSQVGMLNGFVRCLNCGNPVPEGMVLAYCSYNCAEAIELEEYLPEQLELDLEDNG